MSKLFYTNQNDGGSIYITMKQVDNSKKPQPSDSNTRKLGKKGKKNKKQAASSSGGDVEAKPKENMCLIRVHNSKRKISTVVAAKDVNKFQQVTS